MERRSSIDPGHDGGNGAHPEIINRQVTPARCWKACDTVGTETASGYTEAAYTFDVALRLRAILRSEGAHVVLTRRSNRGVGPCITERAAIGNRAHADVAISIHADGGPTSGRGFHVIYPPSIRGLTDDIAAASYRLALDVRAAYRAGTGLPYATYLGSTGLSERSDLRRAQPFRRAEGVRRDGEHAERDGRSTARQTVVSRADRAGARTGTLGFPPVTLRL